MRPVSVAMVGFGTFSDSVVVDFDGADVFALVGPTGSGKSTVIDAICFALYGSLPRYADRRAVGAAVHAQAAEARVALTFDLGDQRYVAVRVVRRDQHGKATTKEARLERADGEVLAGTAKEMDRAVPSLIGLDFDQFTRAVVLPQGEFARFLHDKPAARQDLLVQLLGLDVYERMMQRARSLAATEAAGRARDQERLDALAHATPEVIRALTHHAQACAAAAESWRAAKESAAVVLADVDAAERSMATSTARLAVLASVQPPTDFATIADRLAEVDADRVAADAAAVAAEVAVAEVDARIAEAGDRAALTRARQLHTDLAAAQAELVPRQVASVEADAESARLATVADAAEEHAEALRTANAAEVVRRHLVVGAPCPVCEQTVTATPSGPAPEAWQAARQAAVAAREAATTAAKLAVRAESRCEEATRRLLALAEEVTDLPAAEVITPMLAALDALEVQRRERVDADRRARDAVRAAGAAAEQASREAQEARAAYRVARDRCAGVGLTPPTETENLATDWEVLGGWAIHESEAAAASVRADDEVVVALRTQLAERLAVVVAAAAALGLAVEPEGTTFDSLVELVTKEEWSTRDRLDRATSELEERTTLAATIAERAGTAAVAGELARLLDANHFERWLVSEALTRLVTGASARFGDLSAGRYSFAFDDSGRDLLVVDHTQGDESRSVRTLSGGETFQASLALALALSDQLADLSANRSTRLESIFLDEGFGTLDAETLETVAATIENLGATDRMVGIVTHVPELAARMPVQFRVRKTARSSTVERIDA